MWPLDGIIGFGVIVLGLACWVTAEKFNKH